MTTDALSNSILSDIRAHRATRPERARVKWSQSTTMTALVGWPSASASRTIGRALQKLRKAGKVEWRNGTWYVL